MRVVQTKLGVIVKAARLKKGLTQEAHAERVGVGTRHIMKIENEGGNPSYDLLYKIVRELHIPADSIFYPERIADNPLIEEVHHILCGCDERSLKLIHTTAQAALDSQPTE